MKTISIQAQFNILLVATRLGCSKLEAIAVSKGWVIKTLSTEKAKEIENAVAKVTAKRTKKVRVVKGRRPSRKAAPRFVGSLVVLTATTTVDLTAQLRAVKAQVRATKVALNSYIKALEVSSKATSKLKEVKSKTVGWSESLLKAMGKHAQAVDAVATAKAAI